MSKKEEKIEKFLKNINLNLDILKVQEYKPSYHKEEENIIRFQILLIDTKWVDSGIFNPSNELIEFITKKFFECFGSYPTFNNTSTIFWGDLR